MTGALAVPRLDPRIVIVEGTSFERGRAHGRALRAQIRARVGRVTAGLRATGGIAGGRERRIDALWEYAARAAPEQLREVEGIAEGAGIEPRDAFVLNAFEAIPEQYNLGCTALAFPGAGGSAGAGAAIAQNWDGTAEDALDLAILVHVENPRGTTVMLASAGGLGWAGMNSRGLALLSTDLVCHGEVSGLASQFLRRLMLTGSTVAEALAFLGAHPYPGGRSYVLGDRAADVAVVEVAPGVGPSIHRSGTPAAHANHAEGIEIRRRENPEALARVYPSSRARAARAAELIEAARLLGSAQPSGPEVIRSILRDHTGRPLSICKHECAEEPSTTVASLVFDLGSAEAWIALGPPCESGYLRVGIDDGVR